MGSYVLPKVCKNVLCFMIFSRQWISRIYCCSTHKSGNTPSNFHKLQFLKKTMWIFRSKFWYPFSALMPIEVQEKPKCSKNNQSNQNITAENCEKKHLDFETLCSFQSALFLREKSPTITMASFFRLTSELTLYVCP